MPIGPSTASTFGFAGDATWIEQQRTVFKNPRGYGYYYLLHQQTATHVTSKKSADGINWPAGDAGVGCTSSRTCPPSLWIHEDNTNDRLLVYIVAYALNGIDVFCAKIDDDATDLEMIWFDAEAMPATDDDVHYPSICLDKYGYLWITWTDEFTNKGKQRNKLRAIRSDTTYPTVAPGWETIVDVYGEKTSTDYPNGIRCNAGPFLRSELVPLTAFKDVGVVFSYQDIDASHIKLKACTLDYTAQIDEGTVFALDDTVHIDLIHSSVAESGANSDVFVFYKDSITASPFVKWDVSENSFSAFGFIFENIDSLALSIDKNADPDQLYAFYVKTGEAGDVFYKTGVLGGAQLGGEIDSRLKSAYPDTKYGSSLILETELRTGGNARETRIVIQFNLSSIPSSADVTKATLSIYCYSAQSPADNRPHVLNRITEEWIELETTWIDRISETPWSSEGGTYTSEGESPPLDIGDIEWYSLDATEIVESWIESETSNYGFLLRRTTGSDPGKWKYFRPRDAFETEFRPKLEIEWVQWSAETKIDDDTEPLDYLSASYQDWGLDGDIQVIYTRQTGDTYYTVRFWAVGSEVGPETYEKTYQVDTLFKMLGIQKTPTIDADFQKKGIQESFDIDSLFSLRAEKTVDFDTVFQRQYELQKQVDAVFKRLGIEKTPAIDALIVLRIQESLALDTLIARLGIEKTVDVDTWLKRLDIEKTASIDALLKGIGIEKTASVNALLQKLGIEKTRSIDTVLSRIYEETWNLDAYFLKTTTEDILIDVLFLASIEKTFSLDTLFKKLDILKTFGVDTVLLKESIEKSFAVDVRFGAVTTYQISRQVDALFARLGIEKTTDIDTLMVLRLELQRQIDALIKRQGIEETIEIDVMLSRMFTDQFDLDTLLKILDIEKTADLDTVLKGLGIEKTVDIDALLVLRPELQRVIDVLLQKLDIESTADIDTVFSRIFEEQADVDALFKRLDILKTIGVDTVLLRLGVEKSFAIDARFGLWQTYQVSRQIDVIFKNLGIEKTADVDIFLKAVDLQKTFGIDALIVLRSGLQRQIDAMLQSQGIEKTADLDALFSRTFEEQADLDALFQRLNIERTADVDTLLKMLEIEETVDIDTYLKGVGVQKSLNLDVLIVLRFEVQRQIDTLLQKKGIETTADLDTVFSRAFEKTLGIDTAFLKENIEAQRQVDALFKRLDLLKSFDVDVILLKENIVKSFAIDVQFGEAQTIQMSRQIDALFKRLDIEKLVSIDTLLSLLDIEKTADVDALFKRLDIPLTAAVDVFLKRIEIEKTTLMDALFKRIGIETVSIDTLIVLRTQKTAIINALLSKLVTKQVLIDAILLAVTEKTLYLDTTFQKQGIELQKQVDILLKGIIPVDLLLDAVLKGVGVQRGFGLRVHFWIPWYDEIIVLQFSGKTVEIHLAERERLLKLGEKEEEAEFSKKKIKIKMGDSEI